VADSKNHIIDNMESFIRLQTYVSKIKSEYLCFDVETDSVLEKKANLFGVGFSFLPSTIFYLVWRNKAQDVIWSETEQATIIKWFLDISKTRKLIAHNGIYDILVLLNSWGINLTDYLYHDTILSAHTLQENGPFGLKDLGSIEFGEEATQEQSDLKDSVLLNGGKWNKESKDMYKAETDILAKYCCQDINLTYKLFQIFDRRLAEQNLTKFFYDEEVMPLYRECTIPMKVMGFPVDTPYFTKLKEELEGLITNLEDSIQRSIEPLVQDFINDLLEEQVPVKTTGNFPKVLAEILDIPLPLRKKKDKDTGETTLVVTLAAKDVEKQAAVSPEYRYFYDWLLGHRSDLQVEPMIVYTAQRKLFFNGKEDQKYIFNLASNDHLGYYFFKVKKYKPLGTTSKGKPQVNAAFIEHVEDKHKDEIAVKLVELKKLSKLLSTYVDGILDRQIDGKIYTSFLQFGTTSGRYSSSSPNLQNLPRIKDDEAGLSPLVLHYVNAIKKGFIAGEGNKIVNADYSQLEPCCFASVSEDPKLINVFHKGEDLYSRVAIDVFKMHHLSADKKDPNFLKKVSPEFRNKAKVFVLSVPYGAEESRISQAMNCDYKEATKVINAYLGAYPGLKAYMLKCNASVKRLGMVISNFGRIRHLPEAKELFDKYGNNLLDFKWARSNNLSDERRLFKTCLNNSKNFPIQSMASSIVNRAMIATARAFKKNNLEAIIVANVHDELTCVVKNSHAEQAAKILQDCMENTTKIAVPLVAVPIIADTWADAK